MILENKLLSLIQALKIKLFEELQDYKIKIVLNVTRFYLKGRITRGEVFLREKRGDLNTE